MSAIRVGRSFIFVGAILLALSSLLNAQQATSYVDFDGANDFVQVSDADSLSFGTGVADSPFTFEFWLRPDVVGGAKQNILTKWAEPSSVEYRLYLASGTLRLDLRDSSSNATVSAYPAGNLLALQGAWHHIAVTYDGRGGATAANGITFYIDGAPVSLTRENNPAYVAMENWTEPLQIGREGPNYKQFNGGLDELRFWNVARGAADIESHRGTELPTPQAGLVAYWKFNDGVGTTAADAAAGHLATLINGTAWMSGSPVGSSEPDPTPPEISGITATEITDTGITVGFTTNEPTTGWVSLTSTGVCPCIDVYSSAIGTSHTIGVTGLVQDTPYLYLVKATDGSNNLTVGPEMGFRTLVTPPDSTPPVVSITNPLGGTVSGSVIISASATDNAGVAGVQFRINGVALGSEDTTFPYSIAWDTSSVAEGSHTISAVARDAASNVTTAAVAVTVSNTQPPSSPWYLDFDGTNDYLQVADAENLSFGSGVADSAFTFEFWFRPDVVTSQKQNILTKWSEPTGVEYRLYLAASTLRLDLRDNSSNANVSAYPTGSLLSLQGTWHHVAITYDGRGGATAANGISFFIDGVAVPVSRENHPAYVAMENWTRPLEIGREGPNYKHYRGGLDDVRIWNVLRTQGQVQASMNSELPGPQPGLIAYWKFNEGSGVVAEDVVGGHTATLFNGPVWAPGGPISSPSQQAPAITSGNATTFQTGITASFSASATGQPTPMLSVSGSLPSGVSFSDHGDGTAGLGGTPASGTGGTYPLTISATNGIGQPASQSFTLTVNQTPAITSPAATTFPSGVAGTFAVTTTGFPSATLSVSGSLPSGVTFADNGNGTATIAGAPAVTGSYTITITAGNGVSPQATQSFVLTVTQAPAITSSATAALQIGVPGSFLVTTSGFPVPAISASGSLPGGVTFSDLGNGSATLSGTPAIGSGGSYSLTINANNGVGTAASQSLTLTVPDCVLAPASGSVPAAMFGSPYSFAFLASGGSGHSYELTSGSLASGLSLSNGGVLSGTPTTTGSFAFTVTATNAVGCAASNTYSLQVTPNAQDETFENAVGNTQYSVGAGVPSTPAVVVSGAVLTNDQGPGSLTAGPATIVSALGGAVAMTSQGAFLYTPPAGFAGPSDSFTYTLTDANGATDTAVVTINISGVVWYVNSAASDGGDGRSASPFSSMTATGAAAQEGQIIYVHSGTVPGILVMKAGQTLWGAGAAFALNGLAIPASTQPTISGMVHLANNVYLRSLTIDGGPTGAVMASGLTGNETFESVSLVGSRGLLLANLGGTFTMTGGVITGSSLGGWGVKITGGTGNISIGSPITISGGHSVDIQQRAAGTVTFSGAINDTGFGVLLSANTGSTIAFTGGLTLTTGVNNAFTATGGGTVTVTQDNASIINTITTTSGTALTVQNTEIGAAGLTFRRITAGTSASSAGAGIILDTTGLGANDGSLTVTGNGTAQSGGIIRRKSGPDGSSVQGVGISLSNTKHPSFSWMELSRFDNAAIAGRNVVGLLIANTLITDAGTNAGVAEGPIVFGQPGPGGFNGLQGSGVIRDTVVAGALKDSVMFYNQTGSMSLLLERTGPTPGQCQIGYNSTSTGGHGLLIQFEGTAQGTATINRCRFRDIRQAGVMASASGDSLINLVVTGSATDGSSKSEFVRTPSGQGQDGIVMVNADNAVIRALIENASFNGHAGTAVRMGQASGASSDSLLDVSIVGNAVEMSRAGNAGGFLGSFSSGAGEASRARLLIANNQVNQYAVAPAIALTTVNDGSTPQIDATLIANHVDMRESSPGSGIRGQIGTNIEALGGVTCASVVNNISHLFPVSVSPQAGGIRFAQGGSALAGLEQGNQPLDSPASTVLGANNPAPTLSVMITEAFGVISVLPNGSCTAPATP